MRNDDLVAALQSSIGIYFSFIGSIKNDIVVDTTATDRISIYDHVEHLSLLQKGIYANLRAFVSEPEPRLAQLSLRRLESAEGIDIRNVAALMRSFESFRTKQVDLIRSTEGLLWDKRSEDGCTFERYVESILLNDSFHMSRIHELMARKKMGI